VNQTIAIMIERLTNASRNNKPLIVRVFNSIYTKDGTNCIDYLPLN